MITNYLLFLALAIAPGVSITTKTVVTPSGKIEGIRIEVPYFKSFVYQYRKIPYAQPPLGNLRFQKPQPIVPWSNTLNATSFGPSCMQDLLHPDNPLLPNTKVSEDCLFLNIYQPPNAVINSKKAVMVFIHGGSYIIGTGMLYDGSSLAAFGDVVLVTINYRLGVFGFLSTEDENCPGNFGLWDQRLAIEWVKNNIEPFGGNPDMITIFGESAGGFSVSLQSISPINKGLFTRSIAHSGSSNSFVATSRTSKIAAEGIGVVAGCYDIGNTAKFINCMRSKSASQLLDAMMKAANITLTKTLHFELPLSPVVDGSIVPQDPAKSLADPSSPGNQFFRSLDFVGGDVSSEGSLLLGIPLIYFQSKFRFNISQGIPFSVLCNHIVESIVADYFRNNYTLKNQVCNEYKAPDGDGVIQSRDAVNIYSDLFFLAPAALTLNSHAYNNRNSSTYQFLLSKNNTYGFGYPYPSWFAGAGHAAELPYLFGVQLDPKSSEEDKHIAMQALIYWSNFAKTGNPNTPLAVEVPWTPYNQEVRSYINLDVNISQEQAMYKERVDFWESILIS